MKLCKKISLNAFAFVEFWGKVHPGAYNLKDLQVVCGQFLHEMSYLKYTLQIFSQAHVTPNDSFSIVAYLSSVAIRARDAKETGLQSPSACCCLRYCT